MKELAEQDELPPLVIRAMRSLLGLELPDRLSADLEVLATRKRLSFAKHSLWLIATDQDLAKIEAIERTLTDLEEQRRSAKKVITSTSTKLEFAQHELEEAQQQFLTEGGKIVAEKSQLELQMSQAKDDAEMQRQALRELAAGVLPLTLIQPLL
jgi:DNA sulfur modification protein DndD